MSIIQPTYGFYSQEYSGELSEGTFDSSLRTACAYVRDFIWPNDPDDSSEFLRAVCAAIDVDAAYGASGGIGEGTTDFSIGSFSASISQESGGTYEQEMHAAIKRELSGSGLLYRGLS